MDVVGLSLSPRFQANCGTLVEAALQGARNAATRTEHLWIGDFQVRGCVACGACDSTGQCTRIQDDFQPLMRRLLRADVLVVAVPVYFGGFPAQAKAVVDRCRCFWAEKVLLGGRLRPRKPDQRAGAIVVAAGDEQQGRATARVCSNWFAALDISERPALIVGGLSDRTAAAQDEALCQRAVQWGRGLLEPRAG